MSSKNPLITIVTSTYNAVNDLEACILSVVSQSYKNIQYIIIDGGSTDGTLDIIKKYDSSISIWISEKDNGIYDAWNKGLSLAKGDWISFLGADDQFCPDAILHYVQAINNSSNTSLEYVSSRVQLINSNEKLMRVIGKEWNWKIFRRYMCTAHVGSFHSQKFFQTYGNFNTNFKIVGDYEILLRAKDKLNTLFINSVTVKMKIGGVSNNDNSALFETYKAKVQNQSRSLFFAKYDFLKAYLIYLVK